MNHLGLSVNAKILNVGCGDGLLDIWLSRMGMMMTSVDRNSKVLELAKQSDDTSRVNFLSLDFKDLQLPEESLEGALFLEAVGLVSREEDQKLFSKIHKCLKPGTKFIVDCPEKVETQNSWTKKFPSGEVACNSLFNDQTRIQRIDFSFTDNFGDTFGLLDPTDPIRNSGSGIARYIYSKNELTDMLNLVGFQVAEVPHYYEKNYFSLIATKF